MKQPYRSPDSIIEPPERLETLKLRRYPIWVQVFWLGLLPVVAIIVGQLIPSMTVVCADKKCTLDETSLTGTHHYALHPYAMWIREPADLRDGDDVHLLVSGFRDSSTAHFAFEVNAAHGQRVIDANNAMSDVRAPLRSMGWVFGLFAAGEVALVALFLVLQRRIRIEVNADTGDVSVEDKRYFRPTRLRAVNLGAVTTLDLASLGADGDGHERRVLAFTRPGAEPYELFEAFEEEARRGFHLLERSYDRWTKATA